LITVFWGGILLAASTLPFFLDEKTKANIVEMGLSFASLVFGPMVALFALEVFPLLQKPATSLRESTKYLFLPIVLGLGVCTTIGIHILYKPPFTWMVALGIVSFYTYYYIAFVICKDRT
ncbi:MAG: hypothetical protein JJT78_08785, partial [Leptospira sp.]|nr:hypothetical protein [Leptospira sp.]